MKYLFVTLVLLSFPALADEQPRPNITVTGEAQAKLVPDQAMIQVTVQAEDVKLDVAKKQADDKLRTALDVAKSFGVKPEKIRTDYTQVTPQYDYLPNTNKPKFRNYLAQTSLTITLLEPAKASLLVDALVQKGLDRVGNVQFGLQDEKKARDDILVKALQDAKAKAERMAGALGVKVGKPLFINESAGGYVPQPMPYARAMKAEMASDAASAPPELPGGELVISKNVSVSFAIE